MTELCNTPEVRIGIVGVSRDCFPRSLTEKRLDRLMAALEKRSVPAERCSVIVESDTDAVAAVKELADRNCSAAVIYLGNFGPEGPASILAAEFPGPVMACAAAEESRATLESERGDALCGLLSLSYNLKLRNVRAFIPPSPVGLPDELTERITGFERVARVVIGVRDLKIFGFGPRPADFFACNAPIEPLYRLGVEVMENSELDLFQAFEAVSPDDEAVKSCAAEMENELGKQGNTYPDLLPRLARFEVALKSFLAENLGARSFGVFANKCWPGFEAQFGFVPCYVNGRMAGAGIPVACEVDLYGALSEYMAQLATLSPATLLDVNNSVPADVAPDGARPEDLFMAFHCGNTCASCMAEYRMNYQVIMHRLMEPDREPDITRGTLEGRLRPGPAVMFRLQSSPSGELRAAVAEGAVLDADPCTFGGTGIISIPGFARFYRYALIEKGFPHHAALGFEHAGGTLYEALSLMGVEDVSTPLPDGARYEGESPF